MDGCNVSLCVCVCVCTCEHTFFNDASLVIQHTLHLAASHVSQASLLHKGLAPVEARAVEQVGPHRDQKANIMLPQPYGGRGWREKLDRERERESETGGWVFRERKDGRMEKGVVVVSSSMGEVKNAPQKKHPVSNPLIFKT